MQTRTLVGGRAPGDGGPELSIAKRVDRSGAERAAALAAEQAVRDMAAEQVDNLAHSMNPFLNYICITYVIVRS